MDPSKLPRSIFQTRFPLIGGSFLFNYPNVFPNLIKFSTFSLSKLIKNIQNQISGNELNIVHAK